MGAIKPYDRFPDRPRDDGRFQKRINGHLYYFGRDGNREAALDDYLAVRAQLYSGRQSPATGATIHDIANAYLFDQKPLVTSAWWKQCQRALKRFTRHVGAGRRADELTPDDFTAYARYLRRSLGGHAYNRERSSVLACLSHAVDQGWIDRVRIGRGFPKIPALSIPRRTRLVSAAQFTKLLKAAKPKLRAMILLAANGGYGESDCARLPPALIDWTESVIRFPRAKNQRPRLTPLWPEAVEALRAVKLPFRTRYGKPWTTSAIAHEFAKLRRRAKVKGVTFYDLRHTFATLGNEVQDRDATARVMGHALRGLDEVYVESISLDRCRRVVNHVRSRLMPDSRPSAPVGNASPS